MRPEYQLRLSLRLNMGLPELKFRSKSFDQLIYRTVIRSPIRSRVGTRHTSSQRFTQLYEKAIRVYLIVRGDGNLPSCEQLAERSVESRVLFTVLIDRP